MINRRVLGGARFGGLLLVGVLGVGCSTTPAVSSGAASSTAALPATTTTDRPATSTTGVVKGGTSAPRPPGSAAGTSTSTTTTSAKTSKGSETAAGLWVLEVDGKIIQMTAFFPDGKVFAAIEFPLVGVPGREGYERQMESLRASVRAGDSWSESGNDVTAQVADDPVAKFVRDGDTMTVIGPNGPSSLKLVRIHPDEWAPPTS